MTLRANLHIPVVQFSLIQILGVYTLIHLSGDGRGLRQSVTEPDIVGGECRSAYMMHNYYLNVKFHIIFY